MKKRLFCCLLCLGLLLSGCGSRGPEQRELFAMDTVMDLKVWGGQADCLDRLEAALYALQASYGVNETESLVWRLNRGQRVSLTAQEQSLLEQALDLSARTSGAFDPVLGQAVQLWGFTTGSYRVPSEAERRAALAAGGAEKLHLSGGEAWLDSGRMDLGGIVKGFAADCLLAILEEARADRAILSLGGNILTYGVKADGSDWQVAVQDPFGSGYAGTLRITGTACIVTSGGYQRYFEQDGVRYHHILDPATGAPAVAGLASVTIVSSCGATADALSTALFVLGLEKGAALWRESRDFEAVFITEDGEIYITAGLDGRFSQACTVLSR